MFTDNREEYQKMFDKVKKREIDVVVVIRYDRFGRNINNVLTDMARLGMYGCKLIAGDAYCKNDTPVGEFITNIQLSQNQLFARQTASNVMQGEIHNVKERKIRRKRTTLWIKSGGKAFRNR